MAALEAIEDPGARVIPVLPTTAAAAPLLMADAMVVDPDSDLAQKLTYKQSVVYCVPEPVGTAPAMETPFLPSAEKYVPLLIAAPTSTLPVVEVSETLPPVTLPGSVYLMLIAMLPFFIFDIFNIQTFFFGGTSLLIVVGVGLDTVQQAQQLLLLRHYDGFMKKGRVKMRGRTRYM